MEKKSTLDLFPLGRIDQEEERASNEAEACLVSTMLFQIRS